MSPTEGCDNCSYYRPWPLDRRIGTSSSRDHGLSLQYDLPTDQSSVFIHTEGITTVHRIFVALIGHPQSETYMVTSLNGTAAVGPLPL
jgi:hypothetical protein